MWFLFAFYEMLLSEKYYGLLSLSSPKLKRSTLKSCGIKKFKKENKQLKKVITIWTKNCKHRTEHRLSLKSSISVLKNNKHLLCAASWSALLCLHHFVLNTPLNDTLWLSPPYHPYLFITNNTLWWRIPSNFPPANVQVIVMRTKPAVCIGILTV